MKKALITLALLLFTVMQALQAQRMITGTVIDVADNLGIPGVTVSVQGTTIGTTTNVMGQYSITVPADATHLVFRFLGMRTEEVAIDGKTTIDVVMRSDVTTLQTFEVISFGTARQFNTMAGSAQQITSETLRARPTANVMDALQGQVAGLSVFTNSGDPTAMQSIRLHGRGSLGASSTPLFVVDGMPVEAGAVQAMNANDFESVNIMKCASATSIFGARAANGVVLITTKRGTLNEDATITVLTQHGWSQLADRRFFNRMMNSRELVDFYEEAFWAADGLRRLVGDDINHTTDWLNVFMRNNVPTHQTDISIRGGGGRTRTHTQFDNQQFRSFPIRPGSPRPASGP